MGLENKSYFLPVIWMEYGISSLFVILRFFVRLRTVGFRGLQGDDFFAFLSEVLFTVDMIVMHCAYLWGTNAEFTEDELQKMTSEELRTISRGSKITSIGWYTYPMMIWSMKFVMVFFYKRLTKGLYAERLIKWLAALCILTYIGVFLTVTVSCLPFHRNWQAYPNPGPACAGHLQNIVTTSVCNIATDIALLSIPIPLLWKLRAPLRQKLTTAVFLCGGAFVVAAASVRLALTYGANPSTVTMNLWGTLETASATVAVNTTVLRPLFTRRFWGRGDAGARPRRVWPSGPGRRGGAEVLESGGTTTAATGGSATLWESEKGTFAGTTVVETEVGREEDGAPLPMVGVEADDEIFGASGSRDRGPRDGQRGPRAGERAGEEIV